MSQNKQSQKENVRQRKRIEREQREAAQRRDHWLLNSAPTR